MKNILITGVAGNIGSALAGALLIRGYRVVGIDNFITGNESKLPESENFIFFKGDANDSKVLDSVFKLHEIDFVFHFAAIVGVSRTIENPLLVLDDIYGINQILKFSTNFKIKRFFYSSSSEVYGEPVSIPQKEVETPLNARLPYATVKNIGEQYCKAFKKEHDLDFTIFRFFNTYGPNQSEDFVVPKMLNQALEGKDITIYGDGSQTRTFCYIDDNIETIIGCLERDLFINDVLNIGSDIQFSINELAKLIVASTNSSSRIKYLPPLPEGDMTRRLPDISRMRTVLKNQLLPLEEGIRRLISYKLGK